MKIRGFGRFVLAIGLFMVSATALASGLEQLRRFLDGTRTARAEFSQQVIARSGKPGQQGAGSMAFQRPGKFRWEYRQPYEQILVGDGDKLWSYDKPLNQVVVKPMGDALGTSPAALLAGDDRLERNFQLSEGGEADGLVWVVAVPSQTESGFEVIRIGFRNDLPLAMEVRDNFGQTTRLRFSSFERNPVLAAELFRFAPPPGADVAGP